MKPHSKMTYVIWKIGADRSDDQNFIDLGPAELPADWWQSRVVRWYDVSEAPSPDLWTRPEAVDSVSLLPPGVALPPPAFPSLVKAQRPRPAKAVLRPLKAVADSPSLFDEVQA